ncbi:MAG: alpha/beta fold hydrolase [Ardenticatenaceae bacterium]|nr:alpha/beta fold hydrolase [Ardenticatenaceae bacterium]
MRSKLASSPRPATSYAEAAARVEALGAADGASVNPLCRTQFLTHGRTVERAAVLLHGLTSCPRQYQALAPSCYDLGYNVLVPRLPRHGLADRLTEDLATLTAEELLACVAEAVDIARGLADRVTVVGLSMGGVLASWVAQHREDVDRVVIVSPGFALKAVPLAATPLAWRLARWLPNRFVWWDPVRKAEPVPPLHNYPRFATRPVAEVLRLAATIQAQARRARPAARSIIVVTNANDPVLNNASTNRLVDQWRRRGAEQIRTYEFSADLGLVHDIIDPDQVGQRTDLVYPVLLDLITA